MSSFEQSRYQDMNKKRFIYVSIGNFRKPFPYFAGRERKMKKVGFFCDNDSWSG